MDSPTKKQLASGRNVSILEGFIQTIGINMGGIYLPNFILTAFLLEVMHASHALIGLATSIQFFVGLLQPLANVFVSGVKARRVVAGVAGGVSRLLFVGAIFYGMVASGPGAEAVFMIILVAGAFLMSMASSAWGTWMADLVPESLRGRYFALRNSVASVAGIIAVLVGGWLLKTLPGTPGYVVVYSIAIFTAVAGAVLVLFQFEPAPAERPKGSVLGQYRGILKDRNFMAFVRMVLFFNLALVVAGPFFNVHFLEVLHVPIEVLALFTALSSVTGILGNFFFGKMSEVLGNRFIIRFSLLALMIPTGLMLFLPAAHPLPFVAAVILLQSFFGAGWNLAVFNTSLSISPRNQRALYLGVYNSLNSLSAVFAPFLGGFLIDVFKANPGLIGFSFPPTYVVFALSVVLLLVGLLTFPVYKEGSRHEDYSLRDVVFRTNFPEILYKLFVSTFMPRITSRHRLTEDIADLRSPAAVVPLGRLLDDMDPDVRMSALEGLGKTGSEEGLQTLLAYHARAGVLESIEILRAFKAYASDPRVTPILLAETNSTLLTRRLRALRSLGPAASEPEVTMRVLERLKGYLENQNDRPDEEEYLAWLDLAVEARDWDALDLSLPLYPGFGPWGRRGLLFSWSALVGFRDPYYRYLSYDDLEDRSSFQDGVRRSSLDAVVRNVALGALKKAARTDERARSGDTAAFLAAHEEALFHALKAWNSGVRFLVRTFLRKADRTVDEEVFLLLAVETLMDD